MAKQRKFSLLLPKLSLRLFLYRTFAVFICIILLSGLLGTIPEHMSVSVAQQPVIKEQNVNAAAQKAYDEGMSLYKKGNTESLRLAVKKWEIALQEWQKSGDNVNQALTLVSIGRVHDDLGEKQQAIKYYNSALPLWHVVGAKSGEAVTLNNIGLIYSSLGEKQKALEYYNLSLPLIRLVRDKLKEARVLNNIGRVYDALGEKQKALEYYNSSLSLIRMTDNKREEAGILNNIGRVYVVLGNKQRALDKYYNPSLGLWRAVNDRAGEATTLNNIGIVYSDFGEKRKALDEYYNPALLLWRAVGDSSGEAATLNNIGLIYSDLKEKDKALEYYNSSLLLWRAVGDKGSQADTLTNIAVLQRKEGSLQDSLKQFKTAITIIEELRNTYTNKGLQSTYFATNQDIYKFGIDLLMEMHEKDSLKGYAAEALYYNERYRARNLVELLAQAGVNINEGVDSKLKEKERELQEKLTAAGFRQQQLLQGQHTPKQEEEVKRDIELFISQLDEVQAQIQVQSPEYASLSQSNQFNKLTLKLADIQKQVLDDNTLLLEYSLGKERSYVWVVSKTNIKAYPLPKGADIEAAVEQFNKQLQIKNLEDINTENFTKLSEIVLAPVAKELGRKRLLIVADGKLQTVPFATLPVPGTSQITPLLVNNEIVTLPSASTVGILRSKFAGRKVAPKTIAILADPVFKQDDERLKAVLQTRIMNKQANSEVERKCGDFERLYNTKNEADDILAFVSDSTSMKALGFDASRKTATSPELAKYQILHFATHGCVNEDYPQFSGVALSQFNEKGSEINESMLFLQDIYNLKLPAELVTLSACKTGLGKDVKGEGLIGLTRGFMYAGAKRVAVSLWTVNDLTTADLMKRFYQQILEKKENPVIALREAQLEMWKQKLAPYYWGAFIIQGEWL